MKKKFIGLTLALSLAVAALTGCGGSDSASKNVDQANASQTEETTDNVEASSDNEASEEKEA